MLRFPCTLTMNFTFSFPTLLALFAASGAAQGLNLTAISAANGESTLECWSLSAAPTIDRGAANYAVGDLDGAFLGVLPPKTYVGQAWAPVYQ
jgi:hypothetical protein